MAYENVKKGDIPIRQKMKPYFVFHYLMRNTDENHIAKTKEIEEFLKEYGMYAERRSIYRDIDEINKALLVLEDDIPYDEAEKLLAEDERYKTIVYDKHRKGFYVRQRHYEFDDVRLLAECVYSAKFITQDTSDLLLDMVCDFVSEHQEDKIRHNAFLVDRAKANNKNVLYNISAINDAMSHRIGGEPHTPEQISFNYIRHTLNPETGKIGTKQTEKHTVSPYQILINEGNYYLMAYVEKAAQIKIFRVDRISKPVRTGVPRVGEEEFKKIDLNTLKAFNMYGGERKRITIRCTNKILGVIVEKFGLAASYSAADKGHFNVNTAVEISPQFYGWLAGLGNQAKITFPEEAIEGFKKHLEDIQNMY